MAWRRREGGRVDRLHGWVSGWVSVMKGGRVRAEADNSYFACVVADADNNDDDDDFSPI